MRENLSQMCPGLLVNCPLFLSDFNELEFFSTDFQKNPQTTYCMKTRRVRAQVLGAVGKTDMTKLTVAFRNSESMPNMNFRTKGYIVNYSR